MRNATSLIGALVISASFVFSAEAEEATSFKLEEGKHLDFIVNGKPLVRYMFAFEDSNAESLHKTYKPYHHVFDTAGKEFITKGPGGRYTHHRGIFIGFAKLGHGGKRYDHWHMKNVNMVHQSFATKEADDDQATATSIIHWNDPKGNPILEEERTLTVHVTDDAHLLADWHSTLKAVNGEVELKGDPEHAGMQYRPSNEVAENKSAKYTFHADGISPQKDRDLPWVAMTYKLGDKFYNVQHMRHPDNPSNSVYSAYRDYGRFGNYFVHTIPDGESLKLRYRIRIAKGTAPSRETLAAQYEAFVN